MFKKISQVKNKLFPIGYLKSSKKGFTLAEVLVTLGVVGVLAAILTPSVFKVTPSKSKILFSEIINVSLYLHQLCAPGVFFVIRLQAINTRFQVTSIYFVFPTRDVAFKNQAAIYIKDQKVSRRYRLDAKQFFYRVWENMHFIFLAIRPNSSASNSNHLANCIRAAGRI